MSAEIFPSTTYLEDLGGQTEPATGVYYPAKGEGPDWYESFAKCIYRLVKNISALTGLRAYKDGDLTFGIKTGRFFDGNTLREFAGLAEQALTDNALNSIYLLPNGTAMVSTSGFPDPATTPHLRLATIQTTDGSFDDDAITDLRQVHLLQVAGPVSNIANLAVDTDQLSAAVASKLPQLQFVVSGESSNLNTVMVQVQDARGNAISNRFLLEAWLSDTAYGGETPTAPDTGATWVTGTLLEELSVRKRWSVMTNSSGQAALTLTETGQHVWYLNVAINGRVMCSNGISFS
jgi:hypothetical protein